jgi:hypothetical protein
VTQRKVVANFASSMTSKKIPAKLQGRRDLAVQAQLIPVAPAEDIIPLAVQREKKLGPDYNPEYFASIDELIEEAYGPVTGEFKSISG